MIFIVIRGPRESEEDATPGTTLSSEAATVSTSEGLRGSETKEGGTGEAVLLGERQRKVVVKSPTLAESIIEWEVGDIIVLEGREELHLVKTIDLVSHEISLLSFVHRTERIDSEEQEGNPVS